MAPFPFNQKYANRSAHSRRSIPIGTGLAFNNDPAAPVHFYLTRFALTGRFYPWLFTLAHPKAGVHFWVISSRLDRQSLFGQMLDRLVIVVLDLGFVFHDLSVELVDETVDGGVEVMRQAGDVDGLAW